MATDDWIALQSMAFHHTDHLACGVEETNGPSTMNYVLQVVRGRSSSTTHKLTENVTSLGRHDDCVIRIRSAQVSRRHCELYEVGDQLMLRDLGSSNGTFVNGKRVTGEHPLKHGDELTVGSVTLRVAKVGQAGAPVPGAAGSKPNAADTAVAAAIVVDETALADEEEFEMEFDDAEAVPEIEGIPLADDVPAEPARPKAGAKNASSNEPTVTLEGNKKSATASKTPEDDAVADFLLELDLDDDE
jgi:predicted component of type VI protein secretion system